MGTPKPLLEWQGATLIEYQIAQLRQAGVDSVVSVLGHGAGEIEPLVTAAGARTVVNERYADGRASSLRAGANAINTADTIVVLSVDQPRPADVTRCLLNEHTGGVTLPEHDNKRGHPVVLDGLLLSELREVDEKTRGLRAIINRYEDRVRTVQFDSPVVLLDLNTPADYEAAKRNYGREAAR